MPILKISSGDCLKRNSRSITYFATAAIRSSPHTSRVSRWLSRNMRALPCSIVSFIPSSVPPKPKEPIGMRCRLERCGVETAAPIGYVHVYRWGIFHTGYFLCRYLPYPTLASIKGLNEVEKQQLCDDFIAFTAFLHRHKLIPGDYNPGNILYHKDPDGKYHFALVDINRFHFGYSSMARCMRSFTQLSGVRLSQLAALVGRYCDVRHWDIRRAWKYFLFYRNSLYRKERIKSKFKSLLGLLP